MNAEQDPISAGLLDLSSDWYWEQDEGLRFTRIAGTRATESASGGQVTFYLGKQRWEVGDTEPLEGDWSGHRATLERREAFRNFLLRRRMADGSLRYLSLNGAPVFDADGAFRGYRGTGTDVTERVQAEEHLKRFRLALDHSADYIALIDGDSLGYLDVNASFAKALGYTREEMTRMHVFDIIDDEAPSVRRIYAELLAAPEKSQTWRGHFRAKDRSLIPVEASRHVLSSDGRRVIAAIARDQRERLAQEEHLRRFRIALDHSADFVGLVDAQTQRYIDVNESYARALGYTRAQMLGTHIRKVITGRMVDTIDHEYRALVEGRETTQEWRGELRARDGTIIPVEGRRHVIHSGGRWIVAGIMRDLREKIAAEEKFRRHDAFYRSLIENASDMIAATDLDWRYVFVSPSVEAVSGIPREALLGRRFAETTGVGDHAALRASIERDLQATGTPQRRIFQSRGADGSVRTLDIVVSKGAGPEGEPIYVIVARDMSAQIAAQERLAEREEELRTLLRRTPDIIARWDRDLRCLYVNQAVAGPTGRLPGDFVGTRIEDMGEQGAFPEVLRRNAAAVFASGQERSDQFAYPSVAGTVYFEVRFLPEIGRDGSVASVLTIARDATAAKLAERAVAESEARLRSIVQASVEPLLLVDGDGTTLFANPAAARLFDRPVAELEGAPLGLPLAAAGRPADVEILLPGAGVRPAEMQFAATELDGREVLVVSLHDVSERRRYEEHIQHLATHDRLTALPNRALLSDRTEQAIVNARRHGGSLALLFVDLDQFKLVNDSFGHGAGDALLMEVAARLRQTVREGDTVARLGGDEFVILLTSLKRPDDSAVVAQKIAQALEAPLNIGGADLRLTASVGIALFPEDGEDLDQLLQSADAAMYRAKDLGRNAFQYYSAELGEQARTRVETEAGLRRALERGEFELHYQPQVELSSGRIAGCEALLRWNHPERGLIAPAGFIAVAEETGLIVPIGEWALRTACRDAAGWIRGGLDSVKVAVNLSARQFWRGSVTEVVRQALAESGLPGSLLEVEITESVVARDLAQVTATLEQLLRMGVGVAIDDFGVGYSSLSYLRTLPIRKLKVDRSFIRGIPDDSQASALVGEIVRLAHVLALEVVAEGVETREQALFLRRSGCEAMQGYFFARPMPAAECAALLGSGRRLSIDRQ